MWFELELHLFGEQGDEYRCRDLFFLRCTSMGSCDQYVKWHKVVTSHEMSHIFRYWVSDIKSRKYDGSLHGILLAYYKTSALEAVFCFDAFLAVFICCQGVEQRAVSSSAENYETIAGNPSNLAGFRFQWELGSLNVQHYDSPAKMLIEFL